MKWIWTTDDWAIGGVTITQQSPPYSSISVHVCICINKYIRICICTIWVYISTYISPSLLVNIHDAFANNDGGGLGEGDEDDD